VLERARQGPIGGLHPGCFRSPTELETIDILRGLVRVTRTAGGPSNATTRFVIFHGRDREHSTAFHEG